MADIRASAERSIAAPAEQLYGYIADFRSHHPHFLPPAFSNFQVEQGGVGAGTISTFNVTAGGRTQSYRTVVAEPVPGSVITETDMHTGAVTTFTVTPEGDGSRVRIETAWRRGGLRGFIERLVAPRLLRKIYVDELERLDRYAREQRSSESLSGLVLLN